MPTYFKKDFARIATAIGKKVADVERQREGFRSRKSVVQAQF